MVKVIVKTGTIHFEAGTFEKGEVFECTADQLKQFSPNDIEILADTAPPVTETLPAELPVAQEAPAETSKKSRSKS